MKTYERFARLVSAREMCVTSGNEKWQQKHEQKIKELMAWNLPRGSGFDLPPILEFEESNETRMVFYVDFHAMNETGAYVGWASFRLEIQPTFTGFDLEITENMSGKDGAELTKAGVDLDSLADHIAQSYSESLDAPIAEHFKLEPGRRIRVRHHTVAYIGREREFTELSPHEVDNFAKRIVRLLNENLLPEEIREVTETTNV